MPALPLWKTTPRLSESIFHELARAIIDRELAPGQRVSDEAFAREYGVSRMPVREAFQRLEIIGFLDVYSNRRTVVSHVTGDTIRNTLAYAGYQAGIATHASIPLLTEDERHEASRLAEEASRLVTVHTEGSTARRRLFAYLSERSGNVLHHAHMQDMEYAFERNLAGLIVPEEAAAMIRSDFSALGDAILRGDRHGAESAVRRIHGI